MPGNIILKSPYYILGLSTLDHQPPIPHQPLPNTHHHIYYAIIFINLICYWSFYKNKTCNNNRKTSPTYSNPKNHLFCSSQQATTTIAYIPSIGWIMRRTSKKMAHLLLRKISLNINSSIIMLFSNICFIQGEYEIARLVEEIACNFHLWEGPWFLCVFLYESADRSIRIENSRQHIPWNWVTKSQTIIFPCDCQFY